MALGSTQPLTEMSTRSISWGKDGRCVRLTTYHHPVALSRNLVTLASWNPLGLSRPVMGLLYLLALKMQNTLIRDWARCWTNQESWLNCWQGKRQLFSKTSSPDLEPTRLSFRVVTRNFSHGTKQPGCADDHSPNLQERSRLSVDTPPFSLMTQHCA